MQELERMISIYHTGFVVCLILAGLFFTLSVVLFFKFDIRRIIDMKTGRGAKKTIQKMEEINAKTGKLRQEMVAQTPSELRPEDRIAFPVTAPNLQIQAERLGNVGAEETAVLYQIEETTILSKNLQEEAVQQKLDLSGVFTIVKETMWLHTDVVL